jgi:hypothetical protein
MLAEIAEQFSVFENLCRSIRSIGFDLWQIAQSGEG